jgi:hypothetical protein
MISRACHFGRFAIASMAVLATCAAPSAQAAPAPELKAAFLVNFVKFATWVGVAPGAPLVVCVIDDDRVGDALAESAKRLLIDGHPLNIRRPKRDAPLQPCHVVFASGRDPGKILARTVPSKEQPTLTVSDVPGFAASGGMIELFDDKGRMRFAVNMDSVQKSGPQLSARMLALAKIVKTDPGGEVLQSPPPNADD